MTILRWVRRRTKSRYADDKAVDGFTRVAKDQGLPLNYGLTFEGTKQGFKFVGCNIEINDCFGMPPVWNDALKASYSAWLANMPDDHPAKDDPEPWNRP